MIIYHAHLRRFSGGKKFELQVDPDGTLAAAKQQCAEECSVTESARADSYYSKKQILKTAY